MPFEGEPTVRASYPNVSSPGTPNFSHDRLEHARQTPLPESRPTTGRFRGTIENARRRIAHAGAVAGNTIQAVVSLDHEVRAQNEVRSARKQLDKGRYAMDAARVAEPSGLVKILEKLDIPKNGRGIIHLEASDSYLINSKGKWEMLVADPDPKVREEGTKAQKELSKVVTNIAEKEWIFQGIAKAFAELKYGKNFNKLQVKINRYQAIYDPIAKQVMADLATITDGRTTQRNEATATLSGAEYNKGTFGMKRGLRGAHDLGNALADRGEHIVSHIPGLNRFNLRRPGERARGDVVTIANGIRLTSVNSRTGTVINRGRADTTPAYVRTAETARTRTAPDRVATPAARTPAGEPTLETARPRTDESALIRNMEQQFVRAGLRDTLGTTETENATLAAAFKELLRSKNIRVEPNQAISLVILSPDGSKLMSLFTTRPGQFYFRYSHVNVGTDLGYDETILLLQQMNRMDAARFPTTTYPTLKRENIVSGNPSIIPDRQYIAQIGPSDQLNIASISSVAPAARSGAPRAETFRAARRPVAVGA